MKTAFVTGATGFLGRHLIDVLTEQGWQITAMVRIPDEAAKLLPEGVTLVRGDLMDPSSIARVMPNGVDCVFHTAADTSSWVREADRQRRINVDGTAAIIQAMWDRAAKRLVHVSSTSVFGVHHNLVTEKTARLGITSWVSYVRTKAWAERKVREAAERGLDAVIVNPTHIVGRYDSHNWARLILMLADGTLPGVPPGAGNFANGRAVAEALLAACEKGKSGQSYILGGPYASFEDFLTIAADQLGAPPPKKPAPVFLLKVASRMLSFLALFTRKRPMLTPEEVYFASETVEASSAKAVADLGYREVPLETSIGESIAYLREAGLIKS